MAAQGHTGGRGRGEVRTVEALGRVRDVRDAEIAGEHEYAEGEVQPGAGTGVGECDFEQGVGRVHRVLGDVNPCYTTIAASASPTHTAICARLTVETCIECTWA